MAERDEEHQSLLFLGADLVGSTRYKQSNNGWPLAFLSFYRQFPQELQRANTFSLQFELWKAVGDELLFTVPVDSEIQVREGVRTWLRAMTVFEQAMHSKGVDMTLKGGAFLATFPGPDSRATIPRSVSDEGSSDADVMRANEDALRNRDDELYLYDYFGPSIDTGFRVMHEANERYFPLSVEVAWALAEAAGTAVGQVQDFTFLGEYGFKGVWDGRGYPLFCIDRRWDNSFHVALRLLGSGGLVPHSISEVCRTCSAEPHWPTAAFLPKSHCEGLKRAPDPALARRTEETFATNEVAFSEAETQNLGSEQDGEESFPPAVGITEGS